MLLNFCFAMMRNNNNSLLELRSKCGTRPGFVNVLGRAELYMLISTFRQLFPYKGLLMQVIIIPLNIVKNEVFFPEF